MLLNRCRGILLVASAIVTLPPASAGADVSAAAELEAANARRAEHKYEEARRALRRARAAGASEQLVALELGYLSAAEGDSEGARRHYQEAMRGRDADVSRTARRELDALAPASTSGTPAATSGTPATAAPAAAPALDEAYRAKASGDLRGAALAFGRAKDRGANPQLVAMELGYVAVAAHDDDEARTRFIEAERGPDADMGAQARKERGALPTHIYADAYADAYAWKRVEGATNGESIVPTARVRAFYRPALRTPFELYLSGQATRDTASHGYSGAVLPQVFADDYAIVAAGARLRLWENRVDLFAQIGPAFDLLDDGRDRVAVDARAGVATYLETADCAPAPERTARVKLWPCLEAYGEAIYASRFDHDVIAFVRPRAAAGYLVTGPVLWQAVAEARAAKDKNNDYWNNFADVGAGHRWRLLAPLRVDFVLTVDAGSYYGLSAKDPAPSRLGYVEARGLVTTFVELR